MAAAYVQNAAVNNGSSTSPSCTITPTTGNLVVFLVAVAAGRTLSSVSDGTNTYTVNETSIGNSLGVGIAYAENVTGGALTLTGTLSGSGTPAWHCVAIEFSGVKTSSSFDADGSTTTASESNTVCYAAPASTVNFASGVAAVSVLRVSGSDTHTAATGWTLIESTSVAYSFGYGIFAGGSSGERGGFTKSTSSRASTGAIASWLPATAGGGPFPFYIRSNMMGGLSHMKGAGI